MLPRRSAHSLNADFQLIQPHYPFTPHFQLISGFRMHYLDEGRGRPVLFLHGNPTWSFLFRDYVLALRDHHRCVAVDHIGCGLSDKPEGNSYPFTLSRRIEDLEQFLHSISVEKEITLAVHDWGGPIGFGFAVRHPERIRSILVFNSAAFLWPPGKPFPWILRACRKSRILGFLIDRGNAFARPASYLMCKRRRISAAVRAGYLWPYRFRKDRTAILRFIQDIPLGPDHVSYAAIREIQEGLPRLRGIPISIFWGGRDFIFDREICAEWRRYFPDAVVHEYPEAGHNIAEDEREAILPLMLRFLSSEGRA
jgi:pimeloyl-ACP methyl ester carboxylesterase